MSLHSSPTPAHYTQDENIECIDAIQASLSPTEFRGFLRGNVNKYLWRYPLKGGVKDLLKAHWYLNRLIDEHQKDENNQNKLH